MTGYDFIRFAFQGCVGIHVFKCFQLSEMRNKSKQ
jgi:hypothetical protein